MPTIPVQIKLIHPLAKVPEYKSEHAAGFDLHACIDEPVTLRPGDDAILISSGLSIWIQDPAYVGLILPRSGMGHKQGLVLGNGTGVIDADYQGPLMISALYRKPAAGSREGWVGNELVRTAFEPITINPGDRIAQYLIVPVFHAAFQVVEEFADVTERGAGGFGSTGTK